MNYIDVNDHSKGKKQDYWGYSKKMVLNNKLIKRIQQYREEKIRSINPKNIEKLKILIVTGETPIYLRAKRTSKRTRSSRSPNPQATSHFGLGPVLRPSMRF